MADGLPECCARTASGMLSIVCVRDTGAEGANTRYRDQCQWCRRKPKNVSLVMLSKNGKAFTELMVAATRSSAALVALMSVKLEMSISGLAAGDGSG